MIMKQVTTVNWGQLPIGDVQLSEVVLLGGETGAGKSSFIDAVIGVMTGNELRFAKYNSAQSETSSSKKSKRTVASYVLGADDSAEPHRQFGAHGYAGLYFEPDDRDDGAGQPFTAIVGAEARLERLKSFRDRNVERRSWAQDSKNVAENVLREYNRDALEYQKIVVHSLQYSP